MSASRAKLTPRIRSFQDPPRCGSFIRIIPSAFAQCPQLQSPLSNSIQTLPVSELILSRQVTILRWFRTEGRRAKEGVMHDSQRYRYNAIECLLAAKTASQPYYRKLRLSMASSWLSLARQDEARDNPLASSDTGERCVRGGNQLGYTYLNRSTQ